MFGAALLVLLLVPSRAWAGPEVTLPRFERPPRIDGTLDDPAWRTAAQVVDFRQLEPKEGAPATEKTAAFLGYDAENLYLGFSATDSEARGIRAHLAPRDQIGADDWVAVILDPFGDQRRAYEFICNPLGIQLDAFRKGENEDGTQDFVWQCAARRTADGYAVEMRIPLKSLRFSKRAEQPWRLMVLRNIQRKNEKSSWPGLRIDSGTLDSQMADVRGVKEVSPGRRLELVPEFTASQAVPYERQGNALQTGQVNERLGGNLKFGLTPDWTLDSAYNPDFSQVEADQPQIQVNQRFPLFFAEKRPFFMEGSDLFSTPFTLVHTRTMVDPEYGLKLTGQEGPFSAGLLRVHDRSQGGSLFDVLRLNGALGSESTLGGLYSDRAMGAGAYNRVGAVDGLYRFKKVYSLAYQAADSFTRRAGAPPAQGAAYDVVFSRDARNLSFGAAYSDLQPSFRADSGFIGRVDVRDLTLNAGYRHFPSSGTLLSIRPNAVYDRAYDHEGFLSDEQFALNLRAEFPRQTGLGLHFEPSTLERFAGADFHKRRFDASVYSEPTSYLGASVGGGMGDRVDYGAAVPFLGDETDLNAAVTLRPTPRLSLEQLYLKSRLDTKDGGRVFDENIFREKAAFQWTKEVSSRIIYQYGTLSHGGFADFLVSYLLVPGTAVYAGYDWSFARRESTLQTTRRLVFAKVSYLFRM